MVANEIVSKNTQNEMYEIFTQKQIAPIFSYHFALGVKVYKI